MQCTVYIRSWALTCLHSGDRSSHPALKIVSSVSGRPENVVVSLSTCSFVRLFCPHYIAYSVILRGHCHWCEYSCHVMHRRSTLTLTTTFNKYSKHQHFGQRMFVRSRDYSVKGVIRRPKGNSSIGTCQRNPSHVCLNFDLSKWNTHEKNDSQQ